MMHITSYATPEMFKYIDQYNVVRLIDQIPGAALQILCYQRDIPLFKCIAFDITLGIRSNRYKSEIEELQGYGLTDFDIESEISERVCGGPPRFICLDNFYLSGESEETINIKFDRLITYIKKYPEIHVANPYYFWGKVKNSVTQEILNQLRPAQKNQIPLNVIDALIERGLVWR